MGKEKEPKVNNAVQNDKSASIATKLMGVIFGLIAGATLIFTIVGISFLKMSMNDDVETYENAMYTGYKTEIKSEIQSAIAIVQSFYDMSQSGQMTEAEAKEAAAEAIRSMRYRDDGSGYMWIDDTDYNLVMHPILSEQEGNNRYDLTDQNGVKIIQNIMKSASEGGGYNEFYFTKADGVTVAPKLAYSEMFEPWNWVITTGNYTDDMDAEIAEVKDTIQSEFKGMIATFIVCIVIILAVAAGVSVYFGRMLASGIKKVEINLRRIAGGDLSFEIEPKLTTRKDEIGKIARSLSDVKDSLAGMIGNFGQASTELMTSSTDFSDKFGSITENINNMNHAVEEMAQGTVSLASEAETVSGKIEQLGDVIDVEKNETEKLGASVDTMLMHSNTASESVNKLYEITEITNSAIKVVSEQTEKTNESAAHITSMVEIIKSMADQTNLLSLNASIESARAGEAGRGFAVVAEEIRKLADESATSAAEIEAVVAELTTNAEVSTGKMKEVTENVQEQKRQLQDTRNAFSSLHNEINTVNDVAKTIGEQTDVLDELKAVVSDSISNLVSVVEQSSASAEETSASMQIVSDAINECYRDTQNLVELSDRQNDETRKFTL
jgi:methyl-accepting chemotaxis protein